MKSAPHKAPPMLRFRTHNTRRNFPASTASKRKETNFLHAFERTYLAANANAALAARTKEFGIEGFGRADLVLLSWRNPASADFTTLALEKRLHITAIEGKLTDWRKALQQAFRYRYFAHRAIVVLPPRTARNAAAFLPTFRKLQVGLWSFDEKSVRLKKWCTPRPGRPLNFKAWEKAIQMFKSKLDFGQLLESR